MSDDVSKDAESEGSEEEAEEGSGDESDENSSDNEEEGSSEDAEAEVAGASDSLGVQDETETMEAPETLSHGPSQGEGRKRKRKQRDDENLESNYLERLANDEEPSGKRRKGAYKETVQAEGDDGDGKEDGADDMVVEEGDESSADELPVHESLSADPAAAELEKANRTVFLSNVSVEAITSRKAKKTLLNHLASVLDKNADPPQKIQSIRFRSTPFSTTAMPKRAAYIKKSVLEATTKSTNAYVVYSTAAAARLAVAQLNGIVVLDRHLRVDSVAHPSPVDHRRCVFVGNLGFVDDETVLNVKVDKEGKQVAEKRKRTKTPMDVEEGLWRVFGKEAGKVESVRVVRDAVTRVGKGIAYVQFYVRSSHPIKSANAAKLTSNFQDANDVEAAILLNGRKFPPMLQRELRVTRCKAPHKTARAMEARQGKTGPPADRKDKKKSKKKATGDDDSTRTKYVPKLTAEAQTLAGRASKLLGKFGAAQLAGHGKPTGDGKTKKKERRDEKHSHQGAAAPPSGAGEAEKKTFRAPEEFVFEGRRASERDGRPKDLKFKARSKDKVHKKTKAGAKKGRGAVRAAKWKAAQKGGRGAKSS